MVQSRGRSRDRRGRDALDAGEILDAKRVADLERFRCRARSARASRRQRLDVPRADLLEDAAVLCAGRLADELDATVPGSGWSSRTSWKSTWVIVPRIGCCS